MTEKEPVRLVEDGVMGLVENREGRSRTDKE